MIPIVARLLHNIGITLYTVKENDFVGFFAAKIDQIEDKPHLNSFKDGDLYLKYEDICLFKCNANKLAKQKTLLDFEKKYSQYPQENIDLAEKLTSYGLVLSYQGYEEIIKNGKNSKVYKELYEQD